MIEPLRWLEDPETSASLHEVLNAAPPPPSMPAGLQAQIGAYAVELLSPALAAKTTATLVGAKSIAPILGGTSVVKASLVIALMSAAGAVGYSMAGQAPRVPAASNAVGKARGAALSLSPRIVERQAIEPSSVEPIAAPPTLNASKGRSLSTAASDAAKNVAQRPATASGIASAVAAFEEPSIADEAKLLELARTQLAQDPARALEFVQRHLQLHPNGQLSAERELIAVEALLRLGRRPEAEQRAAPRLQQAPLSLYARRLRKLLSEGAR